MRFSRVLRASAVIAAASLALAACGDDGGAGGEDPAAEEGAVAEEACKGSGEKITVGTKFDQPGLGQQTPEGMDGFDVAVGCFIAKEVYGEDVNVEWKEAPSAERENLISRGDVNFVVATYTINDERKQKVDFAGPYLLAHQDLLVRADYDEITSEADLKSADLKLCSVEGSTSAQNVKDDFAPRANLQNYAGYSECMTGLENEAVDAVTTDNSILAGFASAEAYKDKFKLVGLNLSDEPYGVGLEKGNTELKGKINTAIEKMVADGAWQEYFDKYLAPSGFTDEPPKVTEK